MALLETVMKFLMKIFWPWFKKFVWRIIKQYLTKLIIYSIERLLEKAKGLFRKNTQNREKEARQKAEDAESKAGSSSSDAEAEKFRAIAQVWHEVAEQYRRDNEKLEKELSDLKEMAKTNAKDMVKKMNLDIDFSSEKPILTLGEISQNLPALSPPKRDDKSKKRD